MLVWTCLETQKERKKKKRKKEKGNVTMKYLSLSWQASICLAYLFPLFFLSFFCFLCFGASIYSLTQWHEILQTCKGSRNSNFPKEIWWHSILWLVLIISMAGMLIVRILVWVILFFLVWCEYYYWDWSSGNLGLRSSSISKVWDW